MTRASGRSKTTYALSATLLACIAGLSGCSKPEVPLPAGDAPAPAEAAPAPVVVVPLQPEDAIAATGILASAVAKADLVPVTGDPVKGPSCNLEVIAGVNTSEPQINVKSGSKMSVSGWMFSFPTQTVPVNRYLRVETEDGSSAWQTILGTSKDRPDILPWFNIGDWGLASGFEQDVSTSELAPGRYHLLLTYSENGKVYSCDNGRMINLIP